MKVLNFGSLNFDYVYDVDHFVQPKETMSSISFNRHLGGKGLNQSIALAKAGMDVYHAGMIGKDGKVFIDYLQQYGVHTEYITCHEKLATGHAIIQVAHSENCIILYGGANEAIACCQVDEVLSHFQRGDLLLIQNEISSLAYLIEKAHYQGLQIAFNAAPMNDKVKQYPLNLIDYLLVNEVEGRELADCVTNDYKQIICTLQKKYPQVKVIMTLGSEGVYYADHDEVIYQESFKVKAKDTTAAGDTFTGFFLAMIMAKKKIRDALKIASKASSITVTRDGAAKSIPTLKEIEMTD